MDRVDELAVLIKEITKDHPLSEIEVSALACYADFSAYTDVGRAYLEYCTVCDWLECTSRISPAERKALKDKLYLSTSYGKLKKE